MTFEDFARDQRTVYAVTRALEVISEASRRLPDDFTSLHPEIDWPAVNAAGNVYRHDYEVVDEALVWHTVQHSLAHLRGVAEAELQRLKKADTAEP